MTLRLLHKHTGGANFKILHKYNEFKNKNNLFHKFIFDIFKNRNLFKIYFKILFIFKEYIK